jgi:hypothetical protein
MPLIIAKTTTTVATTRPQKIAVPTASPLLFERDYQVALNYLNMPLIIAITNAIVAMTRPQKMAVSDIALARANALRDIFP